MIIDQVVYACPDCSIEQTQSGPCSACGEPVELARIVRRGVGGRAADPTTARTRALRVRITEREHAAIVEAARALGWGHFYDSWEASLAEEAA